jgi:hypothetical protein
MKRVWFRFVAIAVVMGILGALVPGGIASAIAGELEVARIFGDDRYATAVSISKYDRLYSGYVVLAPMDH